MVGTAVCNCGNYNKYLLETDVAGLHLNIYCGRWLGVAYRWNDNHNPDLANYGYTENVGCSQERFGLSVRRCRTGRSRVSGSGSTYEIAWSTALDWNGQSRYAGKGYATTAVEAVAFLHPVC